MLPSPQSRPARAVSAGAASRAPSLWSSTYARARRTEGLAELLPTCSTPQQIDPCLRRSTLAARREAFTVRSQGAVWSFGGYVENPPSPLTPLHRAFTLGA
jgi:hypothetical protein